MIRSSVTRNVPAGSIAAGVLLDEVSHEDTRQIGILLPPLPQERKYHVRRPRKPDERQKMIYSALGIDVSALPVRKVVVESSPAGEA